MSTQAAPSSSDEGPAARASAGSGQAGTHDPLFHRPGGPCERASPRVLSIGRSQQRDALSASVQDSFCSFGIELAPIASNGMIGSRPSRRAAAVLVLVAAVLLGQSTMWTPAAVSASGDPSKAGAYCPLPEPGQVPQCLAPARAEFADFFEAVEAGEVDDSQSRELEAVLAESPSLQESYLALSSLTYGYFRLAQRAAADPEARPELTARLERWNRILFKAYSDSESSPDFQQAVRQAANDLSSKAPAIAPTGGLIQLIAQADGRSSGMRGALERLVGRIMGRDPER